jgi:hypothetical protein
MWYQSELEDGTYDFGDLIDVNAVLGWKEESAHLAQMNST